MILIPQERYQQLLSKETQSDPISLEKSKDKGQKEPEKEIDENLKQELFRTESDSDQLPVVPPPGEPDVVKQTGTGASKKTISNRKKRKRKPLWESMWTTY